MRKSKLYSLLLSIVIAFSLWLYVVTNISQGDDRTFYNIPVVMEGESVLADRNLMITAISTNNISLHLSGTRNDLNKVNSGNITVKVDLSKIYEPGERIGLTYDIIYPGDVPSNAFVEESKNPSSIYVDVDYRRTREVPVHVKYTGTRSEDYLYDTENTVLDYSKITVVGPAAVADQIAYAMIEVDLTDRVESVSESYRYTLCDLNGNPVDAQQITTNVETVRLDMPIRKIKVLTLTADVIYGGGATGQNSKIEIFPSSIRVSGSEAVLEELGDKLELGQINLADLDSAKNELTFPITLPEEVTNHTGVNTATITVTFTGLKTREFVIEDIQAINVPEGLMAEIINANLTIKVRGTAAQIDSLTEEDIQVTVDFSGAEVGTATYRVTVTISDKFPAVGALKPGTVTATVLAEED